MDATYGGKAGPKSATRSSTSRSQFSSRNAHSEAFYASVEPLSVRRALHNSTGPDPDTNSAPDSRGTAERAGRRYQTSGRSRNRERTGASDTEPGPRGNKSAGQEIFHTVPRGLTISRKEIIERRCGKEDEDTVSSYTETLRYRWKCASNGKIDPDQCERPRTLPSMGKRSQKEPQKVSSSTQSLKKISRQDILRRRASIEVTQLEHGTCGSRKAKKLEATEVKGGRSRSPANFSKNLTVRTSSKNPGWGKEDEGESKSVCDFLTVTSRLQDVTRGLVPRPSTLPKIIHASRTLRLTDDISSRASKDLVKREPPVYGRIRRRKTSLPVGTSLGESVSSLNTPTRFSRGQVNASSEDKSSLSVGNKPTRYLRDPVPDPPYQSRSLSDTDMKIDARKSKIYAKAERKSSKSYPSHESTERNDRGTGTIPRTMSRRRIIENVKSAETTLTRGGKKSRQNYEDVQLGEKEALYGHKSPSPIDLSYTIKSASVQRAGYTMKRKDSVQRRSEEVFDLELDSPKEARNSSRISKFETKEKPDYSSWSKSKQARFRSKSQTRLMENVKSDRERVTPTPGLSMTLPNYVKNTRKVSLGNSTKIEGQRRISVSGVSSKLTKDRSNYVKKSVATHVRTFSDANSARSSSPAVPSSIFGFCTGKRKVHPSSDNAGKSEVVSAPTWDIKMVGNIICNYV